MTDREQCERIYGLTMHTLYRVPATGVSYGAPANARGFWSGRTRQLPAGGGMVAEFDLGERGKWWLRPFGVVEA